jgi:hypothetical protein
MMDTTTEEQPFSVCQSDLPVHWPVPVEPEPALQVHACACGSDRLHMLLQPVQTDTKTSIQQSMTGHGA